MHQHSDQEHIYIGQRELTHLKQQKGENGNIIEICKKVAMQAVEMATFSDVQWFHVNLSFYVIKIYLF